VIASGNSPRIEWVNHAGFVLDYDGVRLLSDPWIDGTAFNEGWALLSETRFDYSDFGSITHIWFSHEHPDHFSPPNVRSIPPEIRARITVLFQQTLDHKVVRFCESLGFANVIELRPNEWFDLSPRLRMFCKSFPDDDSWMALQTNAGTILNINDCVVDSAAKARAISRIVGPVRVLMTQFSYAQWPGNPDDAQAQQAEALEKLERIRVQASVFKPAYIIPFASFVWFCHQENFALNRGMNSLEGAARFIEAKTGAAPVALYPGDRWVLGEAHDWRPAAKRYADDFEKRMADGPTIVTREVPISQLQAAYHDFLHRVRIKNNPLLRLIPVPSTTVYLTDADVTLRLTLHGVHVIPAPESGADIATSAENIMYCLRFEWGSSTLHANGRFTTPRMGRHARFFRFFRIADDNNHGERVGPVWLVTKIAARSNRFIGRAWRRVAR
jgi:hypothetical protein